MSILNKILFQIAHTLLKKHELHEKIAENINLVRNSSDETFNLTEDNVDKNASKAVEAAIKTIVQKTEDDPLFEKIINEIIG